MGRYRPHAPSADVQFHVVKKHVQAKQIVPVGCWPLGGFLIRSCIHNLVLVLTYLLEGRDSGAFSNLSLSLHEVSVGPDSLGPIPTPTPASHVAQHCDSHTAGAYLVFLK